MTPAEKAKIERAKKLPKDPTEILLDSVVTTPTCRGIQLTQERNFRSQVSGGTLGTACEVGINRELIERPLTPLLREVGIWHDIRRVQA